MLSLRKLALVLTGLAALLVVAGALTGNAALWQPAALAGSILLPLGLGALPALKGYQYTAWIVAAIVAGMLYPNRVLYWGELDLRHPWLILIVVQLVMFGMGTQMSPNDLRGVAQRPRGVLVGLLCQFSIMPMMGFLLTKVFHFPPEIAAGIILIGACSSGLASNVMTYLARANLALSVTVTAVATLCAPIATPFFMRLLAGELVDVRFLDMMLTIIQTVVVPIAAAMLRDILRQSSPQRRRVIYGLGGLSALWLIGLILGGWNLLETLLPASLLPSAKLLGFFAGALLAGIGYYHLTRRTAVFDRLMPYLSMFGIIYFTTVTTAAGRDDLLNVGLLLLLAAIIHNSAGYVFGYWISRALGLDISSARAMALEVGLQNGGMASGIAGTMGKLGTLGLAAAVFSPWMNISGSILANYWAKRPVDAPPPDNEPVPAKTPPKASAESPSVAP